MFYKKLILLVLAVMSCVPVHGMSYISSFFKRTNQTAQEQEEARRQKKLAYFQWALNERSSELIFKLLKNADSVDLQKYLELIRDQLLQLKFYKWIFFRNESEFIDKIMDFYPQSITLFRDYGLAHFNDFINKGQHTLLERIIIKNPSSYKEFAVFIKQNSSRLIILFPDFIKCAITKNRECELLLMPEILRNLDAFDPLTLINFIAGKSDLLGYNEIMKNIFRRVNIPKIFKFFGDDPSTLRETPTGKHLANLYFKLFFSITSITADKFSNDPILENLFKQVIAKEREFSKDYYTFVHGQRRAYYFPEKLFTFLWELRTKRPVKDFFFCHVKDLITTEEDLDVEEWRRVFILADGEFERRSRVLFMNYALFANTTNFGSNSSFYVAANLNSALGTFDLSASESFKKLGYETIYEQFRNSIEALHKEYNQLSTYGNLLFIAVPKDKIQEYVYLGMSAGHKASVEIEDIGKTSDIRLIMDTLLNHPEKIITTDKLEFCLVMTQKGGGLDPDTGIKIIPMVTGDPEKLAELQKKEEALFAKIKAAIEKDEQEKEKQKAISRAAVVVNQLVPDQKQQPIVPEKTLSRMQIMVNHLQPNAG